MSLINLVPYRMAYLIVMSAMTAKCFVDTNIVLYTIGEDKHKTEIARSIIQTQPIISAQVVNESISVCLRKLSFSREKAYAFADNIMRRTIVKNLGTKNEICNRTSKQLCGLSSTHSN